MFVLEFEQFVMSNFSQQNEIEAIVLDQLS